LSSVKLIGRIIANTYYDFQQVRIRSMNRIRDIIRKKIEGIAFDEVEEKKDQKNFLKKYTDDVLLKKWDNLFTEGEIPKNEHDYMIKCWNLMKEGKNIENRYKSAMLNYVSEEIVYNEFLNKIRGIGPVLSANLIKEFGDCSNYDNVSRIWAHTGNSVINGIAPKRRKGELLSYNPKLRTMTWKISDSLLKQNKGYYRQIYDTEKEKQLNKIYDEGFLEQRYGKPYKANDTKLSKLHAHNRALRKMRKIFLDHFWHASRELNGLPAEKNYVEGVLQHNHIITWKKAISREGSGS